MKVLIKITHKNNVIRHELGEFQSATIGRSSKSTIQFDDNSLSGNHCKIVLKKEKLEVSDLDSKNGTYLNGIKISANDVYIGDEIKAGSLVITLEKSGCDEDALRLLTFKGDSKDRMDYLLKTDITSGKIAPALPISADGVHSIPKSAEMPKRKILKGKVKLSKHEIRAKNKSTSAMAAFIDVIALILIFLLPILGVATAPIETQEGRIYALVGMEILCLTSYVLFNFKVAEFTIGEKLSGIREMYYNQ